MKSIFEYKDYVLFLKDIIEENKSTRGFQNKLAKAIGIHSSYITRTLSGSVNLTPDHAADLADFLGMNENQTQCLLLLVQISRAGTKTLKRILNKQLNALYQQNGEHNIKIKNASNINFNKNVNAVQYYSFWHHMPIHLMLLNPSPGKQSVSYLAKRLNITECAVQESIQLLSDLGVIEKKDNHWIVKAQHVHWAHSENQEIDRGIYLAHTYWRQEFALRTYRKRPDDWRATVMLSVGEDDFNLIKEELSQCMARIRKISVNAKDEDVFVIGMDAIRI